MELGGPATVPDLLAQIGAPSNGVAIAVNGEIISRSRWSETRVGDGDIVEVITAMQGG